jgi:asparagine synthase (glutamine-hydrolysing)
MCGIAVAIDWDGAESVVRRLISGILHRGDVTDPVISPRRNTAMCTRRLRIVDGKHAIQPQASPNGRLLVSLNGEIYNHAQLRAELVELGVTFKTESDTEVLAAALQIWGIEALRRLVGMYAFVAVDPTSGDFLAARDPLGVKPLYLINTGTGYLFCSEIRPLLSAAETGDVMLLPPGFMLTRMRCAPYVSAIAASSVSSVPNGREGLDRLLREAVFTRLPPGLPAAILFSGGIDSTLVAHYARMFRPETPGYFLGGPGAPDYVYAARYADQTGLDLRLVPFSPHGDETAELIDDVVATTEAFEPSVVRGGLCSFLVARAVHADGFRVALCGEGADELFSGYRPLELAFAEGREFGDHVRNQCLSLMHRTCLQRVDRGSMRFQIETREPFLDPAIFRYAMTLDAAALVKEVNGEPVGKMPLRELYDLYPDQLPRSIRNRQKVPFNEGAGFDASQNESPWVTLAETVISDRELADGKREFAPFSVTTKEELLYIRKLAQHMDIIRVPHLRGRATIHFPNIGHAMDKLKAYAV